MANERVWGGDSEVSIDRVNAWMRAQPWYRQQLAAWGQNPNNVNLNSSQRSMLMRLAQQNGVTIDQGAIEVDPAGNFNPKGHKLRNTLIGAGITAAALTGAGALGVGPMSGLFGGAGAAGAGAGAAATGPALLAGAPTGAALPGLLPAVSGAGAAAGTAGAAGAGGSYVANAVRNVAKQATGGAASSWIDRLAPLIGLGTTAATGGFSSPRVGIDPTLQQQINDLIGVQTTRAQQSQPIYEAAMRLAGQLAPTASTSPRLQSAIRDAGAPVSATQNGLDPQVTEALRRMGGL